MHQPQLDVDRIPCPAALVRPDGTIQQANEHCGRVFGYDRGEMVGIRFESLVEAKDRQELRGLIETTFGDQSERSLAPHRDFEALAKDGSGITLQMGAGPAGDAVLIVMCDMTTRERELAKLRLSEQHIRIGALHTNDLIQFVDVEKDHLGWYGDLDGLLGYQEGEFPQSLSGWLELIHPEDIDRVQAAFDRMGRDGSPGWEFRYRIRAKNGSYRHLKDHGTVVGYRDGRPNEGVGGIIDETEHVVAREALEAALEEAANLRDRLQAESSYLRDEIAADFAVARIIGSSGALRATLSQVESVARTEATVLLLGETGTGKELLARAIHSRSARSEHPLIKVDCGALPESLIESELFGHEKGAFTGAHEQKMGRFELADEGTIFLDEIGELPLALQTKLLRVIEDGEFRRVGGRSDRTVNVRVIAATNRDLRTEMRQGRFRPDLYYRLSVFPIEAPPLRERREDIPELVSFFTSKYAAALGKVVPQVDPNSLDALVAYHWPGNVRELRNVIERSLILCTGDTLTVDPALLGDVDGTPAGVGPLKQDVQALERARIVRALEESHWKIKGEGNAASRLGVTPSGLRSRMKKLGITRPTEPDASQPGLN